MISTKNYYKYIYLFNQKFKKFNYFLNIIVNKVIRLKKIIENCRIIITFIFS
jgi:hypothetical protein